MNISFLCKWWWRLDNEDGLWQELIRAKYLKKYVVSNVSHKLGDSSVWTDLLKVKNIYLKGREVIIKNGKRILFWTDKWSPSGPICVKAPVLFELSTEKDVTMGEFQSRG
jgi:hypothetical protein